MVVGVLVYVHVIHVYFIIFSAIEIALVKKVEIKWSSIQGGPLLVISWVIIPINGLING